MKRYRLGLAAAAIAMIAPISGCAALISPQQTHAYQYAAGDGASLKNLNDVEVRNVLLIANDSGDAQLMYALINTGDSTANVQISVGAKTVKETVKANQAVYHNPDNVKAPAAEENTTSRVTSKPIVVKNLEAGPGELADVSFNVNGKSSKVRAQVLTGDLEYYKNLVPSDSASKPSSTDKATDGAMESTGEKQSAGEN